jgi:hypothetical protein
MMKTRTLLAGLALAGAVTAGVTATAVAQSDPSPAPTTTTTTPTTPANDAADPAAKKARTDFVCAHQDQIKDLMNQRKSLISGRLSLLQEARTSANDAGATKLVARIDTRIAKAQAEATKVDGRMEKLTTWAGEHCPG